MGNFSRDTFDRLKHYVSVRLQQGVPVVDSDWNEHEDIRKHELEEFLRWFVGDGVPMGNDGFAIASVADGNDFSIAAGCCLVNGWSVVNENALRYTEQADPPPLTAPASDRTDTVYLDVWEQEVSSEEDPNLVNPDIGIETCVRIKREWRVRVAEDAASLPEPPAGHVFYPLATLDRKAGQAAIDAVTDLRHTGLTLAGKVARTGDHITGDLAVHGRLDLLTPEKTPYGLRVRTTETQDDTSVRIAVEAPAAQGMVEIDWINKASDTGGGFGVLQVGKNTNSPPLWILAGNTGIRLEGGRIILGNKYPTADLLIDTSGNVGIGTASPRTTLDISSVGPYGSLWVGSGVNHPGWIYYGNSATDWKVGKFETGSDNFEIRDHNNNTHLAVTPSSNVGIGTASPQDQLDVAGFLRILSASNPIRFSPYWTAFPDDKTNGAEISNDTGRFRGLMIAGNRSNGGVRRVSVWDQLDVNGLLTVIGPLDVNGSIRASYPGAGAAYINAPTLEVGGPSPTQESNRATIFLHHHGAIAHQLRYHGGTLYLEGCVNGYGSNPTPHLSVGGQIWAQQFNPPSSDYAEFLESLNGKEIPAGTSVVLEGDRIRPAKKGEIPIGIISANPGVVGGAYREWPGKYLRDELGAPIMEEYEEEVVAPKKEKVTRERQKVKKKTVEEQTTRTDVVLKKRKYLQKEITETVTREVDEPVFEEVDLYDATGKTVIGKHRVPVMETYEEEIIVLDDEGRQVLVGTGEFETKERPKLNPDYDETKEYVPREKRPEWNCVGLLGKLPLRKGQPVAESWIKMKDISDEVELWLVK